MINLAGQRRVPKGVFNEWPGRCCIAAQTKRAFWFDPDSPWLHGGWSIVGLADGQQPIFNEDRSISVVFNGELFDYVERREELRARGHQFVTHCDTEVIPHLWEDYGEKMWERCEGNSLSHYGTSDDANSNSDEIVSASRHFLDAARGLASFRIRN